MGKGNSQNNLWSVSLIVVIACLSILGAIIGLELITSLGVTPNTSVIGALTAMIIARVPAKIFLHFKSIHVQNLAQTAISSATFGAANSMLLPIAVPWVMGRPDLVVPMLVGVAASMVLDAYMLYRMFDTRIFPPTNAWPLGVASAGVITAGDRGGRQAWLLLGGVGVGGLGSFLGIPMSSFGIAFLGNICALMCFGVGLLINGYWQTLAPIVGTVIPAAATVKQLGSVYVPHGFMIGAGLIALVQVFFALKGKKIKSDDSESYPRDHDIPKALGIGGAGYICIAVFLALGTGIYSEMSLPLLVLFVIYAGFMAFVHELIVGIAAMHSGWFPAFAVALITLLLGMMIGFPILALGVLVAFAASTGPAFADMGYDLKAGWLLRSGLSYEEELLGRWHQLLASMLAFGVAIVIVALTYKVYFDAGKFPPIAKVYASTISAGTSADLMKNLAIWAIPGAILQIIGGAKRQVGVMLSTGLLITNPLAGWAVLVGIVLRFALVKRFGNKFTSDTEVFAGGVIAGDAMFSFLNSMYRAYIPKP